MQTSLPANLTQWVEFLGHADIPVLRRTSNHLARLRSENICPGARAVAQIIKQDPLMTVKLLRHLQQHKHQRQAHEVMQAEQALIMLGVENALDQIATESQVEILLHAHSSALVKLLHRTHRAHVAANYAFEWAVRLHDIHFEEIRTAALLHDVTELLLWCYAPDKMLAITALQQQDETLRSHHAQEKVLGFAINELQSKLVIAWQLPELLVTLLNDSCSGHSRVRNVLLAVNLARHAAHGWDNAALPDDYRAIGELLRLSTDNVMKLLEVDNTLTTPPLPENNHQQAN
ncbi:MAG: HDOD domain-containing protein [Nitrosomonas sp.]|nr:HDOD domain-containing protein [Nitrosomonas sp.]